MSKIYMAVKSDIDIHNNDNAAHPDLREKINSAVNDISAIKTANTRQDNNIAAINNKLVSITPNTFSNSSVKLAGDTISLFNYDNRVAVIGNVLMKYEDNKSDMKVTITALCISDSTTGPYITFIPFSSAFTNKLKEIAGNNWYLPIKNFSFKSLMITGENIVTPNGNTTCIGFDSNGRFAFYADTNRSQISFYINAYARQSGIVLIEFTV